MDAKWLFKPAEMTETPQTTILGNKHMAAVMLTPSALPPLTNTRTHTHTCSPTHTHTHALSPVSQAHKRGSHLHTDSFSCSAPDVSNSDFVHLSFSPSNHCRWPLVLHGNDCLCACVCVCVCVWCFPKWQRVFWLPLSEFRCVLKGEWWVSGILLHDFCVKGCVCVCVFSLELIRMLCVRNAEWHESSLDGLAEPWSAQQQWRTLVFGSVAPLLWRSRTNLDRDWARYSYETLGGAWDLRHSPHIVDLDNSKRKHWTRLRTEGIMGK